MADGDRQPEPIRQLFLKGDFPGSNPRSVATTAVGQNQKFLRIRVVSASGTAPPSGNVIDGEIRRIMRHADKDPALVVEHIVNPIGSRQSFGLGTKVVIVNCYRFLAPDPARILEIAHQLLFLGVHADDRRTPSQEPPPLPLDVSKLLIPLRTGNRNGLGVGVQSVSQLVKQSAHRLGTDTDA